MKKGLKFIFVSLLCFVGINNAEAAFTVGESFTVNKTGTVSADGFSYKNYKYNDTDGGENKYNASSNGGSYITYCLDPYAKGGGSNYEVERLLGDTSSSKEQQIIDHGLLAIAANGYNQFNNSVTLNVNGATVSGDDFYLATSIASRAFVAAHGWFKTSGSLSATYFEKGSALTNLGIQWMFLFKDRGSLDISHYYSSKNENTVKNSLNYGAWYHKNTTLNYAEGTPSYNVIYAAQQLFVSGVEAAVEFARNDTQFSISGNSAGVSIVEKTETKLTEYVYATLDVKNLDVEKGFIKNLKLNGTNWAEAGIYPVTNYSMEYALKGSEAWNSVKNADEDISVVLKNNTDSVKDGKVSGTIEIRFLVERNLTMSNCITGDSFITYDYYDSGDSLMDSYDGAILYRSSKDGFSTGNADDLWQRFIVVEKKNNNDSNSNTKTKMVNAKIPCNNSQDDTCKTEVQVPVCSDDEDKAVAKVTAPSNIKKCILNQSDDAGNSYKLAKVHGGVVDDKTKEGENNPGGNQYCQIFCKEDYSEIKLNPIIKDVKCGGYFQLTAHVQGTKSCYTGSDKTTDSSTNGKNSIDKEGFIQDIVLAQKFLAQGWNLYQEADAAEEGIYYYSGCGSHDKTCWETEFKYNAYIIDDKYVNWSTGTTSFKLEHYDSSWSGEYTTDVGETYDSICSCHSNKDGSTTCKNGSKKALTEHVKDLRNRANKLLEDGKTLYERAIKDYNECTTGWTNEFSWLQKLEYEYNEYRGNEINKDYFKLIEALTEKDKEANLLQAQKDTLKENETITICLGKTDDKYNCLGNSVELDGKVDKQKLDDWNYNSEYTDKVFNKYTFLYCTKDSCMADDHYISQASFVKKTVEKSQDYVTPQKFYQIAANGKVTVYSNDFKLSKDDVEVKLEKINGLPISTSATGGGIFKLKIRDLGEFYTYDSNHKDTDSDYYFGRLIDATYTGGKSGKEQIGDSISWKQTNDKTIDFTGEYACNYETPCKPSDDEVPSCPECDFGCESDSTADRTCEWKDCPECKPQCINCIFDLGELNITTKTISTTKFAEATAGRTFGYNWITSSSMKSLQLLNKKAETTIKEITENNEMIYNDSKDSDNSALAFSIKMTPEVTKTIKEYNKEHGKDGGYINNSLTCYDAKVGNNTYKNIYCYSALIDKLVDKDAEIIANNRLTKSENRENNTGSSGYWTLWEGFSKVNKDKDGLPVEIDENNSTYKLIGGPSWK